MIVIDSSFGELRSLFAIFLKLARASFCKPLLWIHGSKKRPLPIPMRTQNSNSVRNGDFVGSSSIISQRWSCLDTATDPAFLLLVFEPTVALS